MRNGNGAWPASFGQSCCKLLLPLPCAGKTPLKMNRTLPLQRLVPREHSKTVLGHHLDGTAIHRARAGGGTFAKGAFLSKVSFRFTAHRVPPRPLPTCCWGGSWCGGFLPRLP